MTDYRIVRACCQSLNGAIKVKGFVSARQAKSDREKASWCAKSLGLDSFPIAMFVTVGDDAALEKPLLKGADRRRSSGTDGDLVDPGLEYFLYYFC